MMSAIRSSSEIQSLQYEDEIHYVTMSHENFIDLSRHSSISWDNSEKWLEKQIEIDFFVSTGLFQYFVERRLGLFIDCSDYSSSVLSFDDISFHAIYQSIDKTSFRGTRMLTQVTVYDQHVLRKNEVHGVYQLCVECLAILAFVLAYFGISRARNSSFNYRIPLRISYSSI